MVAVMATPVSPEENRYELLVRLVAEALESFGLRNDPQKAAAIKDWIRDRYPNQLSQLDAVWSAYLSRAVSDPSNRIERTPGRYTYSLRKGPTPSEGSQQDTPDQEQDAGGVGRKQREQKLYPVIAAWLRSRGYSARDTSKAKVGGIWGNPDVTGLKVVEGFLGQKSLEISTVEVKSSDQKWRYYL